MAAEFDELYREAVSLISHDLRGAASALALRADVLAAVLSPRDREAFKSLSSELLEIDNTLHLIQNVHSTYAALSERTVAGNHWWKMTSRLTANVLPRGSRQVAQCASVELTSREASLLTHSWIAACKGLASCSEVAQPFHAELHLEAGDAAAGGARIELSASATLASSGSSEPAGTIEATLLQSRWLRYANRIALKNHAMLSWWTQRDATLVWKCSIRSTP